MHRYADVHWNVMYFITQWSFQAFQERINVQPIFHTCVIPTIILIYPNIELFKTHCHMLLVNKNFGNK